MSTCNRLDLETLGSQPSMPKNFLGTALMRWSSAGEVEGPTTYVLLVESDRGRRWWLICGLLQGVGNCERGVGKSFGEGDEEQQHQGSKT